MEPGKEWEARQVLLRGNMPATPTPSLPS
jgi:hypothetical protein